MRDGKEDLGGRLIERLQRDPKPNQDVEPPVVNKGLTRSGEAVLIGSAVILVTSPCIAMILLSLSMVPEFMGAEPAEKPVATTRTPFHIPPTLNRSMKRDGKDVVLTIIVDNSRASTPIETAEFRAHIAHIKPEKAPPVLKAIPPGGSDKVVLRFKNVPTGDGPFRLECDYTYPGGRESFMEANTGFEIP